MSEPTSLVHARTAAIGLYVILSAASLAWGLTGGESSNVLGANVVVGTTGESGVVVSVVNQSRMDWEQVQVRIDDRYVLRADALEAGGRLDIRMRDLENTAQLPRPLGLFDWEASSSVRPPLSTAPTDHRPTTIDVITAHGSHQTRVP